MGSTGPDATTHTFGGLRYATDPINYAELLA